MSHTDTAYESMRAYLAFVGHEQLRHEEPVGDQAHPRESKSWEVSGLQRTEGIPENRRRVRGCITRKVDSRTQSRGGAGSTQYQGFPR